MGSPRCVPRRTRIAVEIVSIAMKVLRSPLCRALLAALILPAAPAQAEPPWELVVRDRERAVEIDRSSVIQSDFGSKVAWGRIVLSPERAAAEGYASVKALNRYDCYNRSFFTIKRVYMDARHVVLREEGGLDESPILAARNSVDERMWQEVCRPPSVSDLQKVARDVSNIVEAAGMDVPGEPTVAPLAPLASPAVSGGAVQDTPARTRAEALPRKLASRAHAAAPAKDEPSSAKVSRSVSATAALSESASRLAAARQAAAARADTQWSYEGDTGPTQWGKLRPEWALCAEGKRQSPIDLRNGIAVDLEPPRFDYRETHFRIADTGRTLRVHVGPGMGVELRGKRYELVFFEFRRPSVERIGGQASDMVVHLHHRDADGNVAIVAVLMEGGEQPQPLIQTLWNNLPLERGSDYTPPAVTIDMASLLPASSAHYLFMGSLETPPCTEGVLWAVMKEPLQLSAEQIGVFARLYPRIGRPIQPQNGRLILESR